MNRKKIFGDISLVSANFDNEKHITTFLDSIFNSTIIPGEIIIIDDNSTDNSTKIIEDYEYINNILLIKLKHNVGYANALNIGIKMANRKYIMLLDPDDFISEIRIEKQYNFLENNNQISLVGTNVFYFNNQRGKAIFQSNLPTEHIHIERYYKQGYNSIMHSTILARSEVLKQFKYNQENIGAEDYDIIARIIRDGYKTANLSIPLTFYRIHNSNSSNCNLKQISKKIYSIREEIFNQKTCRIRYEINYLYLLFYRKFLYESKLIRYLFLFLASILKINRAIKRIKFLRR